MAGMASNGQAASKAGPAQHQPRLSASRLAAALGLGPIARSLHCHSSAIVADQAKQKRMLESARRKLPGQWFTAASSHHVRAMLQVCGSSMLAALKGGLRSAGAAHSPALLGMRPLIHVTATMGMELQCEDAVAMLCMAAGVYSPAPPESALAERQLQVRDTCMT